MMFLFLFRDSADPTAQPSATEMQEGYMKWKTWMNKYSKEILEQPPARSGPKQDGAAAVCRKGAVTDGPYAEGKEIVGGWAFIETDSLAKALEIAKEVPMFSSVEVREITTY
ncbi:MAG TPA: YciI family protein [Polyangiaceae bacterium]